jgi:factor associated with neutral sphingomyelinase activation
MYGTHYSTPGYVLHFLVRSGDVGRGRGREIVVLSSLFSASAAPELMLKLQGGKFDAADRLFSSIPNAYRSVTTSPADVKEVCPSIPALSLW